jgi:hypothetical protein
VPPTLLHIQNLHRGLTEKVLDRAESDPAWKQLLLDDPEAAMREAGFPEDQRFREVYESETPPEAMPAPPEEYWQLQRSLWEKMIDKAGGDPQWKQQLLNEPEAALQAANFPEVQQLEELKGEVLGQGGFGQSFDDQALFSWWGRWQVVRLSPSEINVISSGSATIGGGYY